MQNKEIADKQGSVSVVGRCRVCVCMCGVVKQRGERMEPPCGPSGNHGLFTIHSREQDFFAKDTENMKAY